MAYKFSDSIEHFCFTNLRNLVPCYRFVKNKKKMKDKRTNEVSFSIASVSFGDFKMDDEGASFTRHDAELDVMYRTMENYLTCLNDDPRSLGYIAFPLWNSISREEPGWLKDVIHEGEHSSCLLIALKEKNKLVATVTFDDIPKLLERLSSLAAPHGVNITDWNVPVGKVARRWWPEGMILEDNMWLVPIEQLIDLATINMVGSNRFILGGKKDDQKRCRLNYLNEHAVGRFCESIKNNA